MIQKHTFLIFFFCALQFVNAQLYDDYFLSDSSQISIITSGPGDVLYEKFGHTAIRVKDDNFDLLYNYGIFDFDNPTFYADFTKGYMKYKLVKYPFYLALKSAQKNKRWTKEQVLNLTQQQKNDFYTFLEINVLPENASYLYDPFFDNCATKPRDIIKLVLKENLLFNDDFVTEDVSIRQLMNKEIHQNTWGSLGINIALGSKLDKIATPNQYLYLPDYLFTALENSKVIKNNKEENLLEKSTILLNFDKKESKSDTISPFLVILIFSLIGFFITYKDYQNKKRTKWIDFTMFFTTGIFGIVIMYLWFFTNHSTAPNNFNFLWAFAPNFIVAFILLKKETPKWVQKYVWVLLLFLVAIPIIWIAKIQLFPLTIIPLLILVGIRYWFLQKTLNC